MDAISNINELPVVNLAQIFEKLPWQERLKVEQVCKNWQHVGKNLSWANYRIFDNFKYEHLSDTRAMQIKPFFERCGRHLRHLTLRKWSPEAVLSFIRMAPNVQHLKFWLVKLNDESLMELAGIVPALKSLAVKVSLRCEERYTDYNLGLMECFKVMTCLEYLYLYETGALFSQQSFIQFPSNLKYLELHYVCNAAQILSWVALGCKNLKGLHLSGITNENLFRSISQIKSLTYLDMSFKWVMYEIGFVFEELTELRALEIDTLDETVISEIAQHCKKLEHLDICYSRREISAQTHANVLRLASLPNLCSLEIRASNYQKEQSTEFVNRFVAKGNLQYIKMYVHGPLEHEVLLEILRRCKNIRSVDLEFGPMNSDFYSKICQVVDEIDEENSQQRELTGEEHPIVEVQYNKYLAEYMAVPYKWLQFKDPISRSAVNEKWKFGWLGAGKP
ncbi:hypothetical protein Ddc_16447 [Ditylenchus destructor]|nr:hypothetical protein Ddc_16447 [Ditylenchus destructor]